jgi:predicted neuraminidase
MKSQHILGGIGCGLLLGFGMNTPLGSDVTALTAQPGYLRVGFIYQTAPYPECHASTIEQASDGALVAAWFGGTRERHPDVGIWVARFVDGQWSVPVEVADGVQPDGTRHPTWNPVLFQAPGGPLLLFFKTGPSPSTWWGELILSEDAGRTWKERKRLPEGILGPVRNKPVLLGDLLLCGSSTEHEGWVSHMEATRDWGRTWERSGPLNTREEFGAIQPTILRWADDRVQLLHRSRQGVATENWMGSDWRTWSPMTATFLPNPNSGIDGVVLRDGRALLVYNHVGKEPNQWGGRRSPLNVALSKDGALWEAALELENDEGEYSYPAVIQSRDGLVHITYTWKRQRIRHVVVDPAQLQVTPMSRVE